MARLAVVILNYNRGDLLRACLRSIEQAQSRHDVQVWVVDNASSDDSVSVVRNEFPTVRLLVSERNGGFAAGNNLALREILDDTWSRHRRSGGQGRRSNIEC